VRRRSRASGRDAPGRGERALGQLTLVHSFAIDDDIFGGRDAEADLVAFNTEDGEHDIVSNAQRFVGTAGKAIQ
jgi:hypothetical protein